MKTFWIKQRSNGRGLGAGTQTDPFDGAQFDNAIAAIKTAAPAPDESVTINILDGRFETNGFTPGNNWTIAGRGIDITVMALRDVGMAGFHHPDNFLIATAWWGQPGNGLVWVNYLKVVDLTLDIRWPIQSARQTARIKYGGIYAQVTTGLIERVRVINWGSNGLVLENSEAFPIFMVSYSDEKTHIEVTDCVVELQHQFHGGYATAILISTIQTQQGGDRIPWGTRVSPAARITGCRAIGIDGHGYGTANSENVLFLNNTATACKTFFNGDTGLNRNVHFECNTAIACNQGIHFGNPGSGEFSGFRILGNKFDLTEKWLNEKINPQRSEYSYAVRLAGRTKGTLIAGNTSRSLYGPRALKDGMYGVGIATPSDTDYTVGAGNTFIDISDAIAISPPVYTA